MAVKFYLSPVPDKKGENPIRVTVSIKGTRLVSTAGFNVSPSRWDNENHCVKPKTINSKGETDKDINNRLKRIKGEFDIFETKVKHKPTPEELGDILADLKGSTRKRTRREKPEEVKLTVLDYFDLFVRTESKANQWEDGTLQCWAAFRKHLKNLGAVDFDFFNEDGMTTFVNYLRESDPDKEKREMDEKTVRKHFANLRWFLNWCTKRGICSDSQVSHYKPKFKVVDKPVIFLTLDELNRLYNFEIPRNGEEVELVDARGETYTKTVHDAAALAKTRDLFCFCAYTSLRYSDAIKLKRSDIVDNRINVTTKKTYDTLAIELNSRSRAILDKYASTNFPFNLALPTISNQKMNDYLKDLGELCGFRDPVTIVRFRGGKRVEETFCKWELLSTHAGRRTFICSALSFGISPQVVMKWTGHSDYKAMKPYIDIAEETKSRAMKVFDDNIQ